MNLVIGLIAIILFGLEIYYFKYWKRRRIKYNESNKIEASDLSSIVKIFAVIIASLITAIYFFLKFFDQV